MKKFLISLLFLCSLAQLCGTKEEIDKLQQDLLILSQKVDALTLQVADLGKKISSLETKIETVQRSSETADLRVEVNRLKENYDVLSTQIEELKSLKNSMPIITSSTEPQLAQVGVDEAAKMYQDGYSSYLQGKYELAISTFKEFLDKFKDHPLSENCNYWIGECYYGLKDYQQAKIALEYVITTYPKGNKYVSAKLKLALTYYNLGDKNKAKSLLVEILKNYPQSEEASVAREKLRVLSLE
jgi:tol-pal system protein YbgF